jgi:hypothetical protein
MGFFLCAVSLLLIDKSEQISKNIFLAGWWIAALGMAIGWIVAMKNWYIHNKFK